MASVSPQLRLLIIASVAAFLVRFVAKFAIVKGTRIGTNTETVIFGGSAALISSAYEFSALAMFGLPGLICWIVASLPLGYMLVVKSQNRREREEWLRMELSFIDAMTGGGLIVGAMIPAGIAHYVKLISDYTAPMIGVAQRTLCETELRGFVGGSAIVE